MILEINETCKIKNIIHKIMPDSIAQELEIEEGDILMSINGQEIEDIIEYKYITAEEYLEIEIQKKNGEIVIYEIEKEYDEDLGFEFRNPIIDKARSCSNKCVFCFIDQLPKGMRKSLYFKDDDSRLSFLQGNFITLTNMSDDDIDKIIKYRISPINVSIHTTNPDLRVKMLNNKNASKAYGIMKKFADSGIQMNCQVVLCPGFNDGKELDKTIDELSGLYPSVNSVAVVPVGITKHRERLEKLDIYDKCSSKTVLEQIFDHQDRCLEEFGTRFVFASDEFFVMSEIEVPESKAYEGFLQIENGVGMMRKMQDEVVFALGKHPIRFKESRKVSIATGKSAYGYMSRIAGMITDAIGNLEIQVYKIRNDFFGETITVSGLITGQDLIKNLKNEDLGDFLLIPRAMLKADEEIFLDDVSLVELEEFLDMDVIPCENDGKKFIRNIIKGK